MGQVHVAVQLYSRNAVSLFFLVPILFLALVVLPIEFSNAQEDAVEICRPASSIVIATDGGVVDISALDESEVAIVTGAKGSTDSIVAELKEECGFKSFVLVDGNGSQGSNAISAIGGRGLDKFLDPVSQAMLDACNSSVAIVEVQKDDVCVDVPVCGDDRAHPWLDKEGVPWVDKDGVPWVDKDGVPWVDNRGVPWVDNRGVPWVDNRGVPWVDNRAHPWLDQKASPWLELNASPGISLSDVCIDDFGYLWSGAYGYLWSGAYGYLWSGGYGYLWSGGYTGETNASPWLEKNGVPWVD